MTAPNPSFTLLNAFAPTRHAGNQAAVVAFPSSSGDPRSEDAEWMVNVAKDFNFSETAYLVPLEDGAKDETIGRYRLRWFTPETEVPLCGHATLASASALFSANPSFNTLELTTLFSGVLIARKVEGDLVQITLPSLPSEVLAGFNGEPQQQLLDDVKAVFGVGLEEIITAELFPWGSRKSLVVQLTDKVDIAKLEVLDSDGLSDLSEGVVIVTQIDANQPDERLHINSRVFGPKVGIFEDPVTGSAHASLTGYYLASSLTSKILPQKFQAKPLETVINGLQLSARGGQLTCSWDDGKANIVGKAWEFGKGELTVPA
ncbi:hypothetical protein IAT38_007803 [Cryptococcus sp. DSM 104549]